MSMSKKDYEAIARAIIEFNDDDEREPIHTASGAVGYIAHQIADYCAIDNPRFDRDRFLKVCGVQS
jgi:hypothetical protein